MAWRQYSSCRTVRRTGTLAPALSHPSGQEFLRLDRGAVVSGRLVMVFAPQLGESGTLAVGQRAATEPHPGGAARRSLRFRLRSCGRTLRKACPHLTITRPMCRPAGVGSAGLRPAAGPGVMPLGTVRSLRLTAVSTSRSAPLSYDARAPLSSHRGVGVPTGWVAGPVSAERQRGQRGPGATLTCGTLCAFTPAGIFGTRALPPCSDRRLRVAWTAG